MKIKIAFIFLLSSCCSFAQQALFIPDTLHGPVINLTMKQDSIQFFPGNITHTYAFNANRYLGPTLILDKGSNVSITVDNQIGDTTTVHWHGLHVPPQMDGGPHQAILPNTSWNPQFTVMNDAATFWYHPHMHMKTAVQAIKGAAGMIIVRDPVEAALVLPRRYGVDDFPIIVQSQQYDSLNQAMPLGMEDSTLLVNGTMDPYLDLPAQVVRLRLLNASGERSFNFGFTGSMSFKVIGTDGGLLSAPVTTTRIRLAPGERVEILIDLTGMNSQTIHLMSYGSEIPMGTQGGPTMPMPPPSPPMDSPLNGIDFNIMQINVVAQTANPVTSIPVSLVTLTPLQISQTNTFRRINFTADSIDVMDGPFYFNDSTFDMMRVDYVIPLNNVETWTLYNQTMVAHPFHMHDVQFFVLDRSGNPVAPEESGQKDVVIVPPYDSVRFITKFTDFADSTEPYMFHCHILMHEDGGMMGQFVVSQNAVGIHETGISAVDFSVYPNPFSSSTSIRFTNENNQVERRIEICDLSGRSVRVIVTKNNSFELSREGLSDGCYFINVYENGKAMESRRIVVTE